MKKLFSLVVLITLSGCATVSKDGACSFYHWPHADIKDCGGTITVIRP